MVVNAIALNDTTLICDDLLDEWADFIGIRSENGLTQITFYHAKHDSVGLGAGQFHISVSQAMKNLGNMLFPADRMGAKIDGWTKTYNNQGARTGINRIIRQPFAGIDVAISHLRSAPDLVRRATIVTSSLRKQDIQQVLADLKNGANPEPSFVQLYWLLQSFFSACSEVGAVGSVICQP